jgi:hypothetical protein
MDKPLILFKALILKYLSLNPYKENQAAIPYLIWER